MYQSKRGLSLTLSLAALVAGPALPALGEVRGTWLTTTGVDHIRSGVNTESVFQTLRTTGLNTAYIESWKAGAPQFQSDAWDQFTGSSSASRKVLEQSVIQAHRQGMAAVAWFEYGFAAEFAGNGATSVFTPLGREAERQGWMLEDINGQYANSADGFAWMNPAVPEVRQLLVDLVVESVTNHDLDGIQFDDRLAWPTTLGYDATTRGIVWDRLGFNASVTSSAYRNELAALRTESLDLFVDELHTAVRAVDPDVWIGLAPSVNGFSQANYTADWPKWVQQGYFDEVVPQVYRPSLSSFNASLPSNVSPFTSTNREDDGVMGLRFNGSGSDTPLNDLLGMIDATRNAAGGELAGHSIWYSDNVVDFADELEALYDASGGWVPNPRLDDGHRPGSLVATQDPADSDLFRATITEEGLYRVVAPTDFFEDFWEVIDVVYLRPGEQTIDAPRARSQLELLNDRRPVAFDRDGDGVVQGSEANGFVTSLYIQDPGSDLNGDGAYDTNDLAVFAETYDTVLGDLDFDGDLDLADAQALIAAYGMRVGSVGGVGPAWTAGDLNLNGTIDFADAMAFLNYARAADLGEAEFSAISTAIATVPEPTATLALLGLLACGRPGNRALNKHTNAYR
ncbi:MAG: family 10 glycosylhydrolase [Planctomycetota bacterium]